MHIQSNICFEVKSYDNFPLVSWGITFSMHSTHMLSVFRGRHCKLLLSVITARCPVLPGESFLIGSQHALAVRWWRAGRPSCVSFYISGAMAWERAKYFACNETIRGNAETGLLDFKFHIHSTSESHSFCKTWNAHPTVYSGRVTVTFSEVGAWEHWEDVPVRNDWVLVFCLYVINVTKYRVPGGSFCVYTQLGCMVSGNNTAGNLNDVPFAEVLQVVCFGLKGGGHEGAHRFIHKFKIFSLFQRNVASPLMLAAMA